MSDSGINVSRSGAIIALPISTGRPPSFMDPTPHRILSTTPAQKTGPKVLHAETFDTRNESTNQGNGSHRSTQASSPDRRDSVHEHERSLSAYEEPTEVTSLLGVSSARTAIYDQRPEDDHSDKQVTTRKAELLLLIKNCSPLVVTCLLQYTLTGASVVAVGHLGKTELAAVSIAIMTSNLTGYVVYEGLSTGLDTLCAQAYGSGKLHLVGLQFQRMVLFLWLATIPIAAVWLSSTQILLLMIPEQECARLAGSYLRVLLLGAPAFAAFEAGKRFVQAQGLFASTLYVLLFCAPFNVFLNWLLVWRLNWGFLGAPIAVAVTHNLLALGLFSYVYFVNGSQCWPGFSKLAFKNWGPMVKLGASGFLMVIAEFLAFEILTLMASYISKPALAAQAALASLSIVTFQIPFPISVAGSTRMANFIGAGLVKAGKMSLQVNIMMGAAAGLLNLVLVMSLRREIPKIFTNDADVRSLIIGVLPIFACFQLLDAGVAMVNATMRGMGRQVLGSWVNMCSYYLVAIPLSTFFAFKMHWGLFGLWLGPPTGLFFVTSIEAWLIYTTDWDQIVEDASCRNESN